MANLGTTLAALSDPTRREIVSRLATGEATVNELAEPFNVSQQAISKHLAILETARLVGKKRRGREQVCTLQSEALRELASWAQKLVEDSRHGLDTLLVEMRVAVPKKSASRRRSRK